MFRTLNTPTLWATTLSAAGILMVTMGARQSLGLFLAPLDSSTGLGIASISLARPSVNSREEPFNRYQAQLPTAMVLAEYCNAA